MLIEKAFITESIEEAGSGEKATATNSFKCTLQERKIYEEEETLEATHNSLTI